MRQTDVRASQRHASRGLGRGRVLYATGHNFAGAPNGLAVVAEARGVVCGVRTDDNHISCGAQLPGFQGCVPESHIRTVMRFRV